MATEWFRVLMGVVVKYTRFNESRSILKGLVVPSGFAIVVFISACTRARGSEMSTLTLTSSAFQDGAQIPVAYTCDGQDTSPPLEWSRPPSRSETCALVVEDPDASMRSFVHWTIFNVPGSQRSLAAGASLKSLSAEIRQGKNDFGKIGYGGPCPPPGPAHRYVFHLFALDTSLALTHGATRSEIEEAMEDHILAKADLMGRYGRAQSKDSR